MANLLFFDIDGTIIDEHGFIPPSAIEAIHLAQQNGNLCFINTGRPFAHIDPKVKALGFDGYICSCGQHIEYRGKVLLHAGFSMEACRKIADKVRSCHLNALYEAETGVWLDFNDPVPEVVQHDRERFEKSGLKTSGSILDPDFCFDKFCVWESSSSTFEPLRALLKDTCTMIDRGRDHFYECILKEYSKATGIAFVQALTAIPAENCYAFGDGPNDLPMLNAVPYSVAMGDAPDSVKKTCAYVTSDLHSDGLAKAMRHFYLIG